MEVLIDSKLFVYKSLETLFFERGHKLYLVGGTVRDFLLKKPLEDMDLVTDATPSEMKEFLLDADYTFERFGSVKLKYQNVKFDITTLRKENGYSDHRHPNKISFTDKLSEDVNRRDLTINGLYMDKDLKVIDLVNGLFDLNKHLLRMIGDPDLRLKEDPLRILRIYRFSIETGFKIDDDLKKAIINNKDLILKLNKDKVLQEINKSHDRGLLIETLKKDGIFVDTNTK